MGSGCVGWGGAGQANGCSLSSHQVLPVAYTTMTPTLRPVPYPYVCLPLQFSFIWATPSSAWGQGDTRSDGDILMLGPRQNPTQ